MSTLQQLLNLGLLDIGSDDSRFEKMKLAASALTERFKKEPSLLIPATLLSLDENIDEDDTMFEIVEELVIAEWKTLRNTHVNRPRELLRSITIDALEAAVTADYNSAAVVWNTAAAPLQYSQVHIGKADSLIQKMLNGARELAEQEAVRRAVLKTNKSQNQKRKSSASKKAALSVSANISEDEIFADVARSAGPKHPNAAELENPNPHWPNANDAWSHEFSTRMATTITKAVNLSSARISQFLSKELAKYLSDFENKIMMQFGDIEQLRKNITQSNVANQMRLNVLWWSEAMYSPVLQTSYQNLDLPVATVVAAVDLADIVPPLSPASVCYILGETLRRLSQLKADNNKMTIQNYLESIAKAGVKIDGHFPGPKKDDKRQPLVSLVGKSTAGSIISAEDIRKQTGIDPLLALSPAELAMWVFRGIQANRLVETIR